MMDKYCPHCIIFFPFFVFFAPQLPLNYTLPLIPVNNLLKTVFCLSILKREAVL